MKTKKAFQIFLIIGLLIQACSPFSINPLYTNDQRTINEQLIGCWENEDGNNIYTISYLTSDSQNYRLEYCEISTNKTTKLTDTSIAFYEGNLIELNGVSFMDLYPLEDEFEFYQSMVAIHLLSLHSFVRFEIYDDSLQFWVMEDQWFIENQKNSSENIDFIKADGRIIITDSTRNLQHFFSTYANDKSAFGDSEILFKQ